MNNKKYKCLKCNKIPFINIKKDNLEIFCPKCNENKKITIQDYLKKLGTIKDIKQYNYENFYCKDKLKKKFSFYCVDCKKNICKDSKDKNHPNHKIKNYHEIIDFQIIDDLKIKFDKEIQTISIINELIQKIQEKISLLNDKFLLYKYLFLPFYPDEDLFCIEIINNIKDIEIPNISDSIIKKNLEEIINEFNNFTYIKYTKKSKSTDNVKISMPFNSKDEKNYSSTFSFNINNLSQKKTLSDCINNVNKELKENYAFNELLIIEKYEKIINKIKKISIEYEDDFDDEKKYNNYLYAVGGIARVSNNLINEILINLKKEFKKKRKFETILKDRARIQLSSWINSNLSIIENSPEKDRRDYFCIFCKNNLDKIKYFLQYETIDDINKRKIKYSLIELFIDLTQIFTECYFSIKKIDLAFIDNKTFDNKIMKDLTEKKGFCYFTILPGFQIRGKYHDQVKVQIFGKEKYNLKEYPKINEIKDYWEKDDKLFNIDELKDNLENGNIEYQCEFKYNKLIINLFNKIEKKVYIIPKIDNPVFSLIQIFPEDKSNQEKLVISQENNNSFCFKNEMKEWKFKIELGGETFETQIFHLKEK